jgi:SAM-dependent methyltransferase
MRRRSTASGSPSGQRVLEVGCGSGVFLRAAADRGAEVSGIDASEALIELASRRVPEADLRVGDLQFLPYDDGVFDLVAGFNSFFFAANMVAALREAGRVEGTFDVSWSYEYPDEDALSRGMLAAGGIATVVGPDREVALRTAVVDALGPYRNEAGGYSLENEWHYLIASA